MPLEQVFERPQVGVRDVAHVHEIADAGAVGGRVVGPEQRHLAAPAERDQATVSRWPALAPYHGYLD